MLHLCAEAGARQNFSSRNLTTRRKSTGAQSDQAARIIVKEPKTQAPLRTTGQSAHTRRGGASPGGRYDAEPDDQCPRAVSVACAAIRIRHRIDPASLAPHCSRSTAAMLSPRDEADEAHAETAVKGQKAGNAVECRDHLCRLRARSQLWVVWQVRMRGCVSVVRCWRWRGEPCANRQRYETTSRTQRQGSARL